MSAKSIALEMLKRHEGFRSKPYQCPAGYWTIGYGHNLQAAGYTKPEIDKLQFAGWTQKDAEQRLIWDIGVVVAALEKLPVWLGLSDERKAVLIDMAVNLGVAGLLKFKKLLAAITAQDWDKADFEMRNSMWAKQVPSRAVELRRIMKSGIIEGG